MLSGQMSRKRTALMTMMTTERSCGRRHGWNFAACPDAHPNARPQYCGNNDVNPPAGLIKEPHGTAVAGAALARAYNGPFVYNHHEGIVGVCPNCKLLPVRFSLGQPVNTHRLPIDYAQSMGADVINISWGYRRGEPVLLDVKTAINDAATDGRGGLGAVVAISMTNESYDNCEPSYSGFSGSFVAPNCDCSRRVNKRRSGLRRRIRQVSGCSCSN